MALFSRCFDIKTEFKRLLKPFGENLIEQGENNMKYCMYLEAILNNAVKFSIKASLLMTPLFLHNVVPLHPS